MISAKYNYPPPQKKKKNKQTNKKQTRQNKTNKQTNESKKKKTFGVLFFLNAVVIKVIGELYFGKKT